MKKTVFFFNLTAIAMFFVLFFSMGTNAGCTKDIDCKGNRICEKGICVDPGQTKSHPEGIITPEQKKSDDWLKKLDGRRYTMPTGSIVDVIDVRGKVLVRGYIDRGYREWTGEATRVEILGRETTVPFYEHPSFQRVWPVSITFIISEDGDRITLRTRLSNDNVSEIIYIWQR